MPHHGWATPVQLDWLQAKLPSYQELSAKKNYSLFWPSCFEAWFKQWPERLSKFPGIPLDQQLTVEQSMEVNGAIKACKIVSGLLNPPPTPLTHLSMCIQQIQSWFRWRTNSSRTNRFTQKQRSILVSMAEPKNRCSLSQSEIYMKNYYTQRIKPAVDAEIKHGKIEDTSSARLSMGRKLSKKLLAEESDDVKMVVENLYNEQKLDASDPTVMETNPTKMVQ